MTQGESRGFKAHMKVSNIRNQEVISQFKFRTLIFLLFVVIGDIARLFVVVSLRVTIPYVAYLNRFS